MEFIEATCPECNGALQIPRGRDKIICMYCGVEITPALKKAEPEAKALNQEALERCRAAALEGIERLLTDLQDPMKYFKKDLYKDAFMEYFKSHENIYQSIDIAYGMTDDTGAFLLEAAEALIKAARESLDQIDKKSRKEQRLVDYNMMMAVYVLPGILEYRGNSSDSLADIVLENWNASFPKTKLGKATFEDINSGFRKKLCYITSAVCSSLGKPDDCYELTLLRDYRDRFLMNAPGGEEVIKAYYDLAPTIVKRIEKQENKEQIYSSVFENYIIPCIQMIENDQNEKCREYYEKMVRDLEKTYVSH